MINIWENVEDLKQLPISENPIEEITWNDAYFQNHYQSKYALSSRPQLKDSLLAGKAFINAYLSDMTGKKLTNTIIILISGMRLEGDNGTPIIPDSMFIRGPSKVENVGDVDRKTQLHYITTLVSSTGVSDSHATSDTIPGSLSLTNSDIAKWYNEIYNMLDDGQDHAITAKNQEAINYLGFLAITLMRGCAKGETSVTNHIFKSHTDRFATFWKSSSISIITPPPNRVFLTQFMTSFTRLSSNCQQVLTFIIASYKDSIDDRSTIIGILRSGCLLSLQKVGLGSLHWLQLASVALSVPCITLMEYMATPANHSVNEELIKTLRDYVNPRKNERTWLWARLFVDGAFLGLSVRRNPRYALTMLALTGADDDDIRWSLDQFKAYLNSEVKQEVKNLAKAIRKDLIDQESTTAETESAKRVRRGLQNDQKEHHASIDI